MRDSILRNSPAPVNTQALTLVDYTVLSSHATFKPDIKEVTRILTNHQFTAAVTALQQVLVGKQQLLQQQGDDADWDTVAWTTLDSQALLKAVADAADLLSTESNSDAELDVSKHIVHAAIGSTPGAAKQGNARNSSTASWLEQLATVVLTVKVSWEVLPEHQKQADYAPLELVCTTGLLLARLFTHASACAASSGTSQQLALQLLHVLCSSTVQQLLQESLAGHLFIFRWHEQPTTVADLDAVMLCKPLAAHPASSNSSNTKASDHAPHDDATDGPCRTDVPASTGSTAPAQLQLPRLLAADAVPTAHRAWCGSFLLPLLPNAAHWSSGQEVLLGWSAACSRSEQLGLPVDIKPASFLLALEGLWVFAQPPEAYLQQHSATAPTTASAADQLQMMGLWPTFLLRLMAHLEAAVTPHSSTRPEPNATAAAGITTEAVQDSVVAPAAAVLFGMLGAALQHLALHWQTQPAVARAALIRATISESEQPLVVRQRRNAALLGKGKPKQGEVVSGQVLGLAKQLALLLTELLQLERSTCGGPQRDGTVAVTESGTEAVWFSSLWRAWPRGCCQALELLLRCPAPACEPITTLQELLLDDMWESLKVLPLLDDRETAKSVTAAVVSSQKLVRLWQAAAAAVLLGSPAASAAAQRTSPGDERKKGSTSKGSGKDSKAKAQQQAAAGGSPGQAGLAVPAWLVAAAEADPQAALRAGLGLLYRLLDCAQKAYYWRWFTWWQQLQQQRTEGSKPAPAAALSNDSTVGSNSDHNICGSSSVWSSSSSFLSSSSEDSLDDAEGGVNDEDVNAAIEAASSVGSRTGSMSSCCAQLVASRAAAAAAQAAEAVAACVAASDLWCEGAVQLALGYSALAAPCFQFVDAVVKRGFAGLNETQRLQQQEVLLGLLDNVSAGLASNSLILVELHRLGLLPRFGPGAAAAVGQVTTCLSAMLTSALSNPPAAAAAAGSSSRTAANKAASPGSRAAKIASSTKPTPPEPAASLDVYDTYWQGLAFEPIDQLKLSTALAGLAQQPVAVAAVGCHNPSCGNLASCSERRLATLACRACRQVAYCCRACQAAHWKAEGYCHRAECADLQEQQQAEWLPVESCSAEEDEEYETF